MNDHKKFLKPSEIQGVSAFADRVKELLGTSLVEMRLFGSKVRGDFDAESDIDILVIIQSGDWRVREAISNIAANINLEYDCNISPVVYSHREHERNKYFNTLFIQEVEREGMVLG